MHLHLLDVEIRDWKARVLTTPRGLADVSVSENHVWSLLLHKVHLITWKLWKNPLKASFLYFYICAQEHEGFVGFEHACSTAKTYIILTSLKCGHFYVRHCWWRRFLWRPRMRICVVQKPCINSSWIVWLIHGLLPVKRETAFYAIIYKSNTVMEWKTPVHTM